MDTAPDLSPLHLFLHADLVVKAAMLLLLGLSVLVWATAVDRAVRLRGLLRQAGTLDAYARGGTLQEGMDPDGAGGFASAVLGAGRDAAALRHADETRGERRVRVADAMRLAVADALAAVQPGIPVLATVGSAAPFIGLFGTVWGIMNAFTSIAHSGDTSLNTVAPGIAEALAATAAGLAAAIPAVLLYNRLTGQLARARGLAASAVTRLADALAGDAVPAIAAASAGHPAAQLPAHPHPIPPAPASLPRAVGA